MKICAITSSLFPENFGKDRKGKKRQKKEGKNFKEILKEEICNRHKR